MSTLVLVAAAMSWLGASVVAVSEARRGLALGLALIGVGLAGAVLSTRPLGALLLLFGAALAALLRLRDGEDGWGVLPPGSTPGIVLSVVVLVASVVLASTVFQGTSSASGLAPFAVAAVSTVRLLSSSRRQVALGAGSALALALGAFGSTGDILAGSLVAVALAAIPATDLEEVAS
jgi:hypothetical protein